MSRIIGDAPCPQCKSVGRDKTGNHLILFEDGGKFCNRCGYTVLPDMGVQEDNDMLDMETIGKLPSKPLRSRGVRQDIAERYGVRVAFDTSTGEDNAYCYPIRVDGKIVGYKVRELPKKFITVGQTKGLKVEPMGLHECQQSGKKIVIVGGQDDMLAAAQMLQDYADSKYGKGKFPPNVISLTRGEKDVQCIADHIDRITAFEEVILCLDMDEVGKETTNKLASLLGPKAKVMKLSEKDPNDMLKKGKSGEFISAFFGAKRFTPNGIVEGGIGLEKLLTPIERGVYVDVLPGTMDKLKGLRRAELTLVLAPAGVGKTTISKEVGYALNKAGHKIVHVFLEEDLKKTQQSYIAMDNNVHLAKFRRDPSIIPIDKAKDSYERLVEGQLYLDHWGSMSPAEVMADFRYGASWGASFGILDHVSMVFSGTETTNERKEIDMLLTEMAAFTRETKMHLIVVSHIKRANRPFRKKEDYPYWETVASDAGRGSGAFEQLADNIITLEVEYLDEDMNKGRIRTRVAKNREESVLGVGDVLIYDLQTGRIKPEVQEMRF